MKGALSSKPSYQFDENGNLVANEGESEEALATRESLVLYKEGFSGNHPADVAACNDPEVSDEPPVNEDVPENETDQQRQDREARDQTKREAWERKRKIVDDQEAYQRSQPDESREATRGSYQSGAKSEASAANDSNDPNYYRPTTADEVEESDMEDLEEDNDSPEKAADKAKRRHRRGR